MTELILPIKLKNSLNKFSESLKQAYRDDLVALIVYGSASSGEFVDKYSNLNVLVILKNADLEVLKKASGILIKFPFIKPLFLTEDYIMRSTDIFPIEFLDMQENYFVLYGRDVLKGIIIETHNLRYQCEQELKARLISLKQTYLRIHKDKARLRDFLIKAFTSILHISRNLLRLKGKKTPYKKQDVLGELACEFNINTYIWLDILAAKNKSIRLDALKTDSLYSGFVKELEKLVDIVDKI